MKFPDLTMSNPMRLRDLIRQIRSSKTAAEERAVVQKECAYIRDSFRDEDNTWRCRNVAKLLYVSLLGYPSHFGHMECFKLIASTRFTDKRIGYLGAMLLLDEQQDIHVLMTNSLKNDLNHSNQYIVGLALCALATICSPGMSRDLCVEVERLIRSSNIYLRKKAVLCAFRIIRKVPEQIDIFQNSIRNLLSDKNHGILLTATTLITEICRQNTEILQNYRKLVPNLVRILKNLSMSSCSPDHDIAGISDPFLQIQLLRLLRVLGKNDNDTSDSMNDVLAQISTNTDNSKNAGNAILYETVVTIMDIKSEASLRVLAVNILGRFLSNSDKNIRYVALNTLLRVVHADHNAVQRHRAVIVDCLKDIDVSIKRRAMELCFVLTNGNNIKKMTDEILEFLKTCETEFKADCASNLFLVMERYAPSKQWHVDQMIKALTAAGNNVRDDIVSNLSGMISVNPDCHTYAAFELYKIIRKDINQQPLVQVALWAIGEFGDLLINENIKQQDVVEVIEKVLNSSLSNIVTREYAINALMKLSIRFIECSDRIQSVMTYYTCNTNLELQTRATEYTSLFTKHNNIRANILERMPILINNQASATYNSEQQEQVNNQQNKESDEVDTGQSVIKLLDIPDELIETNGNIADLTSHQQNPSPSSNSIGNLLSDIPLMTAIDEKGLKIVFSFKRDNTSLTIHSKATNSTQYPITDFVFKAAVPKTFTIELYELNSTTIPANNLGSMEQIIKVINPNKEELRMRIKINFLLNNFPVVIEKELKTFPEQCYK